MSNMTLDEARLQLRQAESTYSEIEVEYKDSTVGPPTAERVIRQVEMEAALRDATIAVVEAKTIFDSCKVSTDKRRRERATADLANVENLLMVEVENAEIAMVDLESALTSVVALSKRRYAYRQELTGRSPRSHLGRPAVTGWLQYRLRDLELPEFGTPAHHHRAPLAELLGIPIPESIDRKDQQ